MPQAKTSTTRTRVKSTTAHRPPEKTERAQPIDAEQHQRMVAERAYYKALQRDFAPGLEIQDWLDAEQEVRGVQAHS